MQKPVWKKIAEEISLEVSLGRWTVGSIIPNEIDLAKRYKVSRDTMRKALTYLTQQGLFERKPHIGTRVKSRTRTGKFLSELTELEILTITAINTREKSRTLPNWSSMKNWQNGCL